MPPILMGSQQSDLREMNAHVWSVTKAGRSCRLNKNGGSPGAQARLIPPPHSNPIETRCPVATQ